MSEPIYNQIIIDNSFEECRGHTRVFFCYLNVYPWACANDSGYVSPDQLVYQGQGIPLPQGISWSTKANPTPLDDWKRLARQLYNGEVAVFPASTRITYNDSSVYSVDLDDQVYLSRGPVSQMSTRFVTPDLLDPAPAHASRAASEVHQRAVERTVSSLKEARTRLRKTRK